MDVPTGDSLATGAPVAESDSGEDISEAQALLAQQMCLGDRSAFAALVRIWEQRVLTIAYRIVGNLQDAEDVRQIVFLKLAQSRDQLRDPARFAGWLRRCTVNEAITWLRRRQLQAKGERDLVEEVASMSPSPPEQAAADEQSGHLHAALRKLDVDSRALLSLRFDECLTIRQIADVVEKAPMTVHSQIERAIGQLRRLLRPDSRKGATS